MARSFLPSGTALDFPVRRNSRRKRKGAVGVGVTVALLAAAGFGAYQMSKARTPAYEGYRGPYRRALYAGNSIGGPLGGIAAAVLAAVESAFGTTPFTREAAARAEKLLLIAPSPIHGRGVFVTETAAEVWIPLIRSRDLPLQLLGAERRTKWGQFINHSETPTAKHAHKDGTWYAVVPALAQGYEVTLDYREGPWFVDKTEPYVKPSTAAFGEPISTTVAIIGLVTAIVGAGGVAGGAAASASAQKQAQYMAAGVKNPCVERLNAQISQVKDGVGLFRWASARQRAEHARKLELEQQRDYYLSNPDLCSDVVLQRQQEAAQLAMQQQDSDTSASIPYYTIGGVALTVAGLMTVAAIMKRG